MVNDRELNRLGAIKRDTHQAATSAKAAMDAAWAERQDAWIEHDQAHNYRVRVGGRRRQIQNELRSARSRHGYNSPEASEAQERFQIVDDEYTAAQQAFAEAKRRYDDAKSQHAELQRLYFAAKEKNERAAAAFKARLKVVRKQQPDSRHGGD